MRFVKNLLWAGFHCIIVLDVKDTSVKSVHLQICIQNVGGLFYQIAILS